MSKVALVRQSFPILLSGLLAMTLAACGANGIPSAVQPTASANAPAQQAANSAPATNSSDLLAIVKERGVLRVANTQSSPPWSLLDEQNQPAGYDVDVANEIAKRLGIAKVEFVADTFKNFVEGIKTDKYDIVIAGQTPTEERRQQVDFSDMYQGNGVAIFVAPNNTTITKQDDLANKRIAVTAGSTQETQAREKFPNAEIKTYENATLALSDVAVGRADAALFSGFVGSYLAEKNNLKVKIVEFLGVEYNAMSFRKDQTAFKDAVNKALADMIADGTLTQISKKWLGGLDMVETLKQQPKS